MLEAVEHSWTDRIGSARLCRRVGRLTAIHGLVLEATGLDVQLGELVRILPARSQEPVMAEVVGLRNRHALLMPHASVDGLCLASEVEAFGASNGIPVGFELLGRVIDASGKPLDEGPSLEGLERQHRFRAPINPLHRRPIREKLSTGVRAVDLFTPLGRGQRIGILAGSGVGKSTLLGMMSRHAEADVAVIALIGERGREVGDFIRDSLGAKGMKSSVVVVASAEQPAVMRRQAAYTATGIAEWFRARGKHVLLIMDSITRFAFAQREIGLATGEPMGSRGYPPSVFGLLPPLMERAGSLEGQGSITGVYTVLVEGDDMNEPVADHMRAVLDGHIVLSRDLAARGHYPAIDIQGSISRLSGALYHTGQRETADQIRHALAEYRNSEDLIRLGAYEAGSNATLDAVIALESDMSALLRQPSGQHAAPETSWSLARDLAGKLKRGSSHVG
ncbi:type III secretion system FliI/YscN family ATPase [Fluviicoccus keumensis]|uniref:protein-secreting ATPase n=1 Tax=Fluviicoccus keumensis TaxID=1435465 RepID=A0A4Q7YP58_9GAMM|nr:FliI/YscN family ATPase [Fluviicoccus keumensis]RZU38499.1 type III secretion system FliI/YscN family ATPase [Fluviicoccus keumensis]